MARPDSRAPAAARATFVTARLRSNAARRLQRPALASLETCGFPALRRSSEPAPLLQLGRSSLVLRRSGALARSRSSKRFCPRLRASDEPRPPGARTAETPAGSARIIRRGTHLNLGKPRSPQAHFSPICTRVWPGSRSRSRRLRDRRLEIIPLAEEFALPSRQAVEPERRRRLKRCSALALALSTGARCKRWSPTSCLNRPENLAGRLRYSQMLQRCTPRPGCSQSSKRPGGKSARHAKTFEKAFRPPRKEGKTARPQPLPSVMFFDREGEVWNARVRRQGLAG
jgi:hypothetical protein